MSARMEKESFEDYKRRRAYEKEVSKQRLKGTRVFTTSDKNRQTDRDDENTQSNFIKVHTQIQDIFEFMSKLGKSSSEYERKKSEYFKKRSSCTVKEMRIMRDALVDTIKPLLPKAQALEP